MPDSGVELPYKFKLAIRVSKIFASGSLGALGLISLPFIRDVIEKINPSLFNWTFFVILLVLLPTTIISGGAVALDFITKVSKKS